MLLASRLPLSATALDTLLVRCLSFLTNYSWLDEIFRSEGGKSSVFHPFFTNTATLLEVALMTDSSCINPRKALLLRGGYTGNPGCRSLKVSGEGSTGAGWNLFPRRTLVAFYFLRVFLV